MPVTLEELAKAWDGFFGDVEAFLDEVGSLIEYYRENDVVNLKTIKRNVDKALRKYHVLEEKEYADHPLFKTILAHMALIKETLVYLEQLVTEDMALGSFKYRSFADYDREFLGIFEYLEMLTGEAIAVLEDEILTHYKDAFFDIGAYDEEEEGEE